MMIIYKITNLINGKVYVGSAINYKLRWNNHESNLKYNRHPNSYLQAAWNKDGGTNFEFAAIEMVKDKKELVDREQFWKEGWICVTIAIISDKLPI